MRRSTLRSLQCLQLTRHRFAADLRNYSAVAENLAVKDEGEVPDTKKFASGSITRMLQGIPEALALTDKGRNATQAHYFEIIKSLNLVHNGPSKPRYGDRYGSGLEKEASIVSAAFAAFDLLEDMLAKNIQPTIRTLKNAAQLACAANSPVFVSRIKELFFKFELNMDSDVVESLMKFYADNYYYEQMLEFMDQCLANGWNLTIDAWKCMCLGFIQAHDLPESLDVLKRAGESGLVLSKALYFEALHAYAIQQYMPGVDYVWRHVIESRKITQLDEGLCTLILNVCARHGEPILATEVMRHLAEWEVKYQEHHYASLIGAYCTVGDLKNAFAILTVMRSDACPPTQHTAGPIVKAISTDLETLDRAFFTLQDMVHPPAATEGSEIEAEEKVQIDVSALNAVIDASIARTDLSRAVATYREAEALNVKPDIHTFNSLIGGCALDQQIHLAKVLFKQMKESQITPNETTYESLIKLSLTLAEYEDAFMYLEEMKEVDFQPSQDIYELIIKRCIAGSDSRASVAYEEMRGWGYPDNGNFLSDSIKMGFIKRRNFDGQSDYTTVLFDEKSVGTFDRFNTYATFGAFSAFPHA